MVRDATIFARTATASFSNSTRGIPRACACSCDERRGQAKIWIDPEIRVIEARVSAGAFAAMRLLLATRGAN